MGARRALPVWAYFYGNGQRGKHNVGWKKMPERQTWVCPECWNEQTWMLVFGVQKDVSCLREGVCGCVSYRAVTPGEKVVLGVRITDF